MEELVRRTMPMWNLLLVFGLLAGFLPAIAGEPHAPEVLPEDSVKLLQARAAINDIWRTARIYLQDRGEWPESVDELVKTNYVQFDSAVAFDWSFSFTEARRLSVCAQQRYLAKNANTVSLPDVHRLCYDTETGMWRGSGVPPYRFGSLSKAQEHELALTAQACVLSLVRASAVAYQDRGVAGSVEMLERTSYVIIPTSIKANWGIEFFGFPVDSVVAVSTQWMPDGAGKRFVYHPPTDTWSGYGVLESMNLEPLIPYLESGRGKRKIR